MPPQIAIGSSKTANLITRAVSLYELSKHRDIDWRRALILAVPSLIGGWIGAEIVSELEGEFLRNVIGIMIIFMAGFMLLKPKLGLVDLRGVMSKTQHAIGYVLYGLANAIATISGGGGALTSFILITFFGETYISSVGVRKLAGYAGALSGTLVFIINGLVSWHHVFLIAASGSLGSILGVRFGVKSGETWVKTIVLTVIIAAGLLLLVT